MLQNYTDYMFKCNFVYQNNSCTKLVVGTYLSNDKYLNCMLEYATGFLQESNIMAQSNITWEAIIKNKYPFRFEIIPRL